jgi:hypothetical protein
VTLNHVWTLLGWVAFALNVWGNLALTTKGVRGWIIRIACNLCWMPYGIYTAAWALLANHLVFVAINCYGWWKWSRDAKWEAAIQVPGETPPTREIERARRIAYAQGFVAGQSVRSRVSA